MLVKRFTDALGPPLATPERVMASDHKTSGRREPARFREFKWHCPVCGCGDWLWHPLVIDTDGHVYCHECRVELPALISEIDLRAQIERDTQRILTGDPLDAREAA